MKKKHEPLFDENPEPAVNVYEPLFQKTSGGKPISVTPESDLTPITQKEIPQVDAESWESLTVPELYDQLAILENRIMSCKQYGQGEAATQIGNGVLRIRAIILKKDGKEVKLI